MDYNGYIKEMMKSANVEIGDKIEVFFEGKAYRGIVMPKHEFSSENILTLKLENGYNIGIKLDRNAKISLIEKKEEKKRIEKTLEIKGEYISMLGTGGTIASYVDYRTGAVHPALTADELVFSVPDIKNICNVKAKVVFSLLSENIKPKHWQILARAVADELNNGAKGVVVPHGTDIMAYTSAALSFMLKNLTGPVVLVGAQRSSDRPSSDAFLNLLSACRVASSDICEVVVVMHENSSDNSCLIHRGTKVRKMHTSRRDAFKSINSKPIGRVFDDKITFFTDYRKRGEKNVEVMDKVEEKTALVYFYPAMKVEFFNYLIENYNGIVIAGSGLGHVSSELIETIKKHAKSLPIVMTSQCLYGNVNMKVYSGGRDLIKAGIISGGDMLPETAYVKLMWVLGQTKDLGEVKALMEENIANELSIARCY